jgi:hypothetical protein
MSHDAADALAEASGEAADTPPPMQEEKSTADHRRAVQPALVGNKISIRPDDQFGWVRTVA